MSERLYFDHHVQDEIVSGVRGRGVDCLTARDDGRRQATDEDLLQRATDLGRVMVSSDQDMIVITAGWLAQGRPFARLVVLRQLSVSFGKAIEDLALIAEASLPGDLDNAVIYLPL